MVLIPDHPPPIEDVWVALDLETTGLSPANDEIIEIGAVRFQGADVLDTYQTFVNPGRRLSDFIVRYTGITQELVDGAPAFSRVAGELATFIGSSPIVGHNLAFDLDFLDKKGLKLANPWSDTWDIAYVLFPGRQQYSLASLAKAMSVTHTRPHRATDDAVATMGVFLQLLAKLSELDPHSLAEMRRLAGRSSWVLSFILSRLDTQHSGTQALAGPPMPAASDQNEPTGGAGITGVDLDALGERLRRGRALRPNRVAHELDVEFVASLLKEGSPLAHAIPGFEERPEQIEMARVVAEAVNDGERLLVEAGTGVGKSLAYLLPALMYASMNNQRVVVSTNTINLQEQLLNKDVPSLLEALSQVDETSDLEVKFTQLKGRANYLCMRRWSHLRSSDTLSPDEARLLGKIMVWLRTTATGDRTELNLGHRSSAAPWERLSAQGARDCQISRGPCFLRAAREKAAESHLVIVNHALLLSDLTSGGSLIPPYDILIVDEAHHLEEEATRHLGFDLTQPSIDEHLQSLGGDRGLLNGAVSGFRGTSVAATRRNAVQSVVADATALLPRVRQNVARMYASLTDLVDSRDGDGFRPGDDFRITSGTRAQPGWSELEIQWENADVALSELGGTLSDLQVSLEGLEDAGLIRYESLVMELAGAQHVNAELRRMLAEFIPQPKSDGIYWVTRNRRGGDLAIHAAPIHVGETLDELLYSKKRCVILTSATLSANDSFDHVRQQTGFVDAQEILLGSPFDYPRSALLCVPDDMPQPTSPEYQAAVEQAITDAAVSLGGRTMALFTSHASLQAASSAIRGNLQARGLNILAQGIDGTPQQLVRRFLEDPSSVLLGTSSFWEGVDLAGESLKVLLVARLPFSVPSEPVFAARSELYEDPFNSFAVPQAILRLRQGFGRLIRTKTDIGVAVILDQRIVSRRYGKAFLSSLPPVTFKTCKLHNLGDEIRDWVGQRDQ